MFPVKPADVALGQGFIFLELTAAAKHPPKQKHLLHKGNFHVLLDVLKSVEHTLYMNTEN